MKEANRSVAWRLLGWLEGGWCKLKDRWCALDEWMYESHRWTWALLITFVLVIGVCVAGSQVLWGPFPGNDVGIWRDAAVKDSEPKPASVEVETWLVRGHEFQLFRLRPGISSSVRAFHLEPLFSACSPAEAAADLELPSGSKVQ